MSTRQKWEYLTLTWTYNSEHTKQSDVSPKKWDFWEGFSIWRPGADAAETHDSRVPDEQGRKPDTLTLMNELGAEGWELVDTEVDRNRVSRFHDNTKNLQGWQFTPINDPIRRRYFFKRPAESG